MGMMSELDIYRQEQELGLYATGSPDAQAEMDEGARREWELFHKWLEDMGTTAEAIAAERAQQEADAAAYAEWSDTIAA